MVNKERMVEEFLQLVRIDSLSKNERQMADTLKQKLQQMGFEVIEDDAGKKVGGTSGNLICNIKGSKPVPAVMLAAHMDTVVPGIGKTPVVEGNIIKSDGKTILGGDDAAGLECILEVLRVLKEKKLEHGDLQVVFTIYEEGGLFGAKNLDYSKIKAKYGFVLDGGGPIGCVAVNAPSQNSVNVTIKGKSAHAGMEPEKGINAIQVAAAAISQMKLGRIDEETTANFGIINGGLATNIVCETVELKGEARSRSMDKLEKQTQHMKECFIKAAEQFGAKVDLKIELEYSSYNIPEDSDILKILGRAAEKTGIPLLPESTGGGSDTNVFNSKGIQAIDMSVGMDKVHSVEEQINADDMVKAAEFLINIITSVE